LKSVKIEKNTLEILDKCKPNIVKFKHIENTILNIKQYNEKIRKVEPIHNNINNLLYLP